MSLEAEVIELKERVSLLEKVLHNSLNLSLDTNLALAQLVEVLADLHAEEN